MMSIGRIPGDWPRENIVGYQTEHFFLNPSVDVPERRKTPPITPYSPLPALDDGAVNSKSRPSVLDQTQPTGTTLHNSASYTAPDELFIPGLSLPAKENTSLHPKSVSLSPTTPNELSIPQIKPRTSTKPKLQTILSDLIIPRSRLQTNTMSPLTSSQNTSLPQALTSLPFDTPYIEAPAESALLQSIPPTPQEDIYYDFGTRNAPPMNSLRPFYDNSSPNSDSQNPVWIKWEPPKELLKARSDTTNDLNSIILPSIQRVRDRETMKELRRDAAEAELILAKLTRSSYAVTESNRVSADSF